MTSFYSEWLVPQGRGRWITAVLATAAVIASGAGLLMIDNDDADEQASDAAFSVGGRAVTVEELDARVSVLSALYGVQVPNDTQKAENFRRDAAKSMAISIVMDDRAAESGIAISNDDASKELSAFLEKTADDQAFEDFLSQNRLTEDDVLAEIKRNLAVGKLYTDVTADVPQATNVEARAMYESNPASFRTQPARILQNIVVSRRSEAVQALQRLRAGQLFAVVARQVSLDQRTRNRGGLLGAVTRSELEPDFGDAAFAARAGSLFGPVQSQFGWNVARVQRAVPARQLRFAQVRERLVHSLTEQRQQRAWAVWVNDAIASADIAYAEAYEPADPGIEETNPPALTPAPTSGHIGPTSKEAR